MYMCPICGLALNTRDQLETHIEIKHQVVKPMSKSQPNDVKYLTVRPFGNQFKMQIHRVYPPGVWQEIGGFYRASDGQHFIALGQDIYAGEVDEDKLSADIADFLGLGKRVG